MAHASRVLFGRQATLGFDESAPLASNCALNPTSSWLRPDDLWKFKAPPAYAARGADRILRTKLDLQADTLVHAAGVLFAADEANVPVMREALVKSLADRSPGLSQSLFGAQVSAIPDGALIAGIQRQRATVGAVTDQSFAGMNASAIGTQMTSIGRSGTLDGVTFRLNNLIARSTAVADSAALLGPLQASSTCRETSATAILGGQATPTSGAGLTAQWHPRQLSFATQDAFAMAQQLRARALILRKAAGEGAGPSSQARDGLVAELDAWAGGLRVVADTTGAAGDITLDLFDIDLASYKSTSVKDDFVLAFGTTEETGALVAACAAGTATCPEVIPGGIWNATSASLTASNSPEIGLLRDRWTLQFAAAGFAPASVLGGRGFNDRTVYVVRKGTPNAPGIVLGALRGTGGVPTRASFAFSPFRRELVDRAFAFPKNASTLGASLGDTRDMCIPGVPRDLYVPMENESTSDGDAYESSWKHYMTLARQAAEKSDSLGRELIQIGTEKDTRKEAFGTQLTESTGIPMNYDCLSSKDGKIDASKCSPELGEFLNETTIDLVLLSTNPVPPKMGQKDAKNKLREYLGCTGSVAIDPPACAKLAGNRELIYVDAATVQALPPPSLAPPSVPFYFTALGLAPAPNTSTSPIKDCETVAGAMTDGALEAAIGTPILSDDAKFGRGAGGVRVSVAVDGEFSISINGSMIGNSRSQIVQGGVDSASNFWPGCARAPNNPDVQCQWGAGATTDRGQLNRVLERAFYACAGTNTSFGSCLASDNNEWRDLNAIRWQIQGAAWLGHAMAGRVPAGAFTAPLPLVNFGTPTKANPSEANACSLIPSGLGTGLWQAGGNSDWVPATSPWASAMSAQESAILTREGPIVSVNDRFGSLPTSVGSSDLFPDWYRSIYEPTVAQQSNCWSKGFAGRVSYLHATGRNSGMAWSDSSGDNIVPLAQIFSDATRFGAGIGPGANASGRRGLASWRSKSTGPEAVSLNAFIGALKGALGDPRFGTRTNGGYGLQSQHPEFYRWDSGSIAPQRFGRYRGIGGTGTFIGSSMAIWDTPAYYWYGRGGAPLYATSFWWPCNDHGDDRDHWGACLGLPSEPLPSVQSPDARVRFFLNSGIPQTEQRAFEQFRQAMALACLGTTTPPRLEVSDPPDVRSTDDIIALEGWMQVKKEAASLSLSRLNAEDVPFAVVRAFQQKSVGNTAIGGRAGEATLAASGALQRTVSSFKEALAQFDNSQRATATLREELSRQDALEDVKDASRRISDLQAAQATINNVVGGLRNLASSGPFAAVGMVQSAVNAGFQVAINAATSSLRGAEDRANNAERRLIFTRFADEVARSANAQEQAISSTRQAAIDFQSALIRVKAERTKSLDLAARASGAGAWVCATDSKTNKDIECTSPVNTVLNRRFSATKIRYEAALRDARALAYIARRAIEQRFGQRLDQMSSPIGPLEAPSSWADTVCTLQGVDYEALRKESTQNANGEQLSAPEMAAWNDREAQRLAKSNVIDYVDKLQRFVDYYGIAYPSHDGDDTAMISLREDALRNKQSCLAPSKNLLPSSEAVYRASGIPNGAVGNWVTHLCASSQTNCVRTSELAPASVDGVFSSATWLRNEPRFDSNTSGRDEAGINAPGNYVTQAALLDPGTYVLSFYGAALDANGAPSTNTSAYRAIVQSEDGQLQATSLYDSEAATLVTGAGLLPTFATRRTLQFTVTNRGLYRIGFAPSAQPGGVGSIGLVQPQLQRDERAEGPTAYEPTERMTPSSDCPSTPAQLRGNFTRKCENNRCFYELNTPISIDSAAFTVNGNPLQNKLAAANFNYRHIDIAVNLVGTGLRSCDANPTPACYASGTVDYDLLHEANGIGIVAYDAAPRVFDFGTGRISSGKALATERYLTLPLSGADASLVSQQGVLKTELRGRPIDGRYTLRVYDNPALRWEKLEDIQLLLHTRYWSRVDSPSSF